MDSRDREILEEMKRELAETTTNHTYRFNEPEIRRKVPAPYVKIEVNLGEGGQ